MTGSEGGHPVRVLLTGCGEGVVLALSEPLNAWGGLDPDTGIVNHHSHPQRGRSVAGKVLVMPESRGSGTNAQVFAQAWAAGNGPVAVVLAAADYVLCVGAVVSRELYGVRCPVVVADAPNYASLTSGDIVAVRATEAEATLRIVQPTPRAGPPDATPTTK